jgi:hypothetical protein
MPFPSLQNLAHSIKQVTLRFPFALFFTLAGTIAAITYVELSGINIYAESWCIRIILAANIGLLLSLSATLFTERKGIRGGRSYAYQLIPVLIGVSLVLLLDPLQQKADYIRFFILSIAAHLMVSFAAFTQAGSTHAFWQFNKTLFLHFLTSAIYSIALFMGLAAAIGAMNFLFNFNFESDTFLILWICIVGIFNTVFFLAGVPCLQDLNHDFNYPKGLKVFTQYVLIPLASVYVVILLSYEIKIALEWNLPKGMVSNLILGYAVFGILALLLVYPIREKEENKWIKTYAQSFYFLMLPLIVLLFLAVGTRIINYGITEARYYLILLATWLLFITIYFLFSKRQNIKLIPVSLSILALLSVYGPQSAFSVSSYSQSQVLVEIFKKNNAFKNGKFTRLAKISKNEGKRAVQTLSYIISKYDYQVLQPYIAHDLEHVVDSMRTHKKKPRYRWNEAAELNDDKTKWVQNYIGLGRFSIYGEVTNEDRFPLHNSFRINVQDGDIMSVKGYDFIVECDRYTDKLTHLKNEKINVYLKFDKQELLNIRINNDTTSFKIKGLLKALTVNASKLEPYRHTDQYGYHFNYDLPPSMLSFSKETKSFIVTYQINSTRFYWGKGQEQDDINFVNGYLLIKEK